MSESHFNETVGSLMKGMETLLSTHTVVGEATRIDDTIILPLVDVSFGVGAGAGNDSRKDSASGGFGAKMSPSAVLIIRGTQTRLINVRNTDTVTKILDLVPDLMNRFGKGADGSVTDDEAVEIAFPDREGANKDTGENKG